MLPYEPCDNMDTVGADSISARGAYRYKYIPIIIVGTPIYCNLTFVNTLVALQNILKIFSL